MVRDHSLRNSEEENEELEEEEYEDEEEEEEDSMEGSAEDLKRFGSERGEGEERVGFARGGESDIDMFGNLYQTHNN